MSKPSIAYPEMFTAIGKYIEKHKMSNVCVMEFEDGVIITGSVFYESSETTGRSIQTKVLSFADLQRSLKER